MDTTQIRLARRTGGDADASTFTTVTEALPEVGEGEVLLAVRYLSLDPSMRGGLSDAPSYADPLAVGDVIVGGTVAEVLESRYDGLAVGDQVLSYVGWQTHEVVRGETLRKLDPDLAPT